MKYYKEMDLRKLFFIFCVMSCFCSCTEIKREIKRTEDDRCIEVINNIAKYIEFDGHEYVFYRQGHRGSICHSPKCPCLKDYKK